MISYDEKDWWGALFFRNPADTARRLAPLLLLMVIYTAVVAIISLNHLKPTDETKWTNIEVMHSLLGFALSMLLVFRTNSAYDRWWEGRRQWGSLVNHSRNLAVKLATLLSDLPAERAFFRIMIPNFAFVLKNSLRGEVKLSDWEETPEIPTDRVLADHHGPSFVAGELFARLHLLQQRGVLTEFQLLLLNNEFQGLLDVAGACERIRNTPIPYSYSTFLKKFIVVYCITLPFGYVMALHYWVIPVVTFIFYVLASLEEIAEEIEEPFGIDANDLPTDDISANIRRSVNRILSPPTPAALTTSSETPRP